MSGQTGIEWTEATWNPVTGCSKVSPGCAHCYAERIELRFGRSRLPWTPENAAENVRLHPDRLDQPLRWRRPRMVFVNSMSDLFHAEIPARFIDRVFATMATARQHTFQVLTKRPREALAYYKDPGRVDQVDALAHELGGRLNVWPLPNVWVGVSIENARHTWRADVLRQIPAAVRFISAEPLLGSLLHDRDGERFGADTGTEEWHTRAPLDLTGIDWLICGGESGPNARPMDPEWARELRDTCVTWPDGVPFGERTGPAFFFKQWGEWAPDVWRAGERVDDRLHSFRNGNRNTWVRRVGKRAAGRLLDGREWNEVPAARQAVTA